MSGRKTDDVTPPFDQFVRTLSLVVEDDEIQRKGRETEIYFDASDIWISLQGFPAFYRGRFEGEAFQRRKTLIHALLAASWLEKVRLLIPHQEELKNLISLTPYEVSQKDYRRKALQFIGDVEYYLTRKPREKLSDDLFHRLASMAIAAPNKFKIVQALRYGTWSQRLAAMRKHRSIELTPSRVELSSLLKSTLYATLLRYLAERRKTRKKSNERDAYALCILADLVASYRASKEAPLPRFYDPTKLFREAVTDCGLEDRFRYPRFDARAPQDQMVFVDEDYLEFKAAQRPPDRIKKLLPDAPPHMTSPETLRFIYEQLSSIPEDSRKASLSEALSAIRGERQSLISREWKSLERLAFFDVVWLPYLAEREVAEVLEEYELREDYAEDPSILKQATDVKEGVEKTLVQNTQDFSLMMEIGHALPRIVEKRSEKGLEFSLPDLGVLMYAIPEVEFPSLEERMQVLLGGALPDDEDDAISVMSSFVACVEAAEEPDRSSTFQQELARLSAILWLGDSHKLKLLERTLGRFSDHTSREYQLLRLALPFRWGSRDRGGKAIEELLGSAPTPNVSEEICSAFVFFSAAKSLGYKTTSEDIHWSPSDRGIAVRCARQAISRSRVDFDVLAKPRKIYAVNMHLYYRAEFDRTKVATKSMAPFVKQLLAWKDREPDGWNFRYDDTLARFYRRLALASSSEMEWKANMEEARKYCVRAVKGASHYPLADELSETIRGELTEGWQY